MSLGTRAGPRGPPRVRAYCLDMEADDVAEATATLYQVSPDEFVAARDQLVKELRSQGARDAASAVSKLRRPTLAAWLVNLLVADAPELPEDLGELARQLRDAQDELAGDELRALGRQRHQLVAGLVARARDLARAAGRRVGSETLGEVEATLRAALADPDVAREVLSGQLTQAVSVASGGGGGFGRPPAAERRAAGETATRPGRTGRAQRDGAPARSAGQQRADERRRAAELRSAERELRKAEEALRTAEDQRTAAERSCAVAGEALGAAEQRATWLRTQLQQAQAELAEAEATKEEATAEAEAAAVAAEAARDHVDAARAHADLL